MPFYEQMVCCRMEKEFADLLTKLAAEKGIDRSTFMRAVLVDAVKYTPNISPGKRPNRHVRKKPQQPLVDPKEQIAAEMAKMEAEKPQTSVTVLEPSEIGVKEDETCAHPTNRLTKLPFVTLCNQCGMKWSKIES